MRHKRTLSLALSRAVLPAVLFSVANLVAQTPDYPIAEGPFKQDWESLKQYQCPEWFRDAKFGIWAHWGPQSVTGAGDWYARQMYMEGGTQYKFHLAKYGHPSEFGYKDIVPLWKAEKFDPDRLMEKYKRAGAKYFVSMGVHHDNFDLWDSKHHKWNSVNIGPKKDIVGLWAAAARKHGLRFGVSEHLERSYSWFNTNKGADKQGPKAGVPYDGNDPKFADFYFPPHDDTSRVYPLNPPEWWKKQWFDRIKDLLDQHKPDLLYTDGGIPFEEVGRRLLAHFYNQNIQQHGGKLEAVYNIKCLLDNPIRRHGDYEEGVAVQDVERMVLNGIKNAPWQTDTSVGDWFHRDADKYKTPAEVVHLLADIVSKNGNLLINFTQKPDGTLDEGSEKVLDELAIWMPIHGEAIYGTRPWQIFGEGPAVDLLAVKPKAKPVYTAEDIRFTTKGESLYAIALGWPEDSKLVVRSLALPAGKISDVTLLGFNGKLDWQQTSEGLAVTLPAKKVCDYSAVLKITGSNLKPAVAPAAKLTQGN